MSLKYRIAVTIFVLEALMMGAVLTQTVSQFDEATQSHLADAEDVVLNLLTGVGGNVLLTQEYATMQPFLDHVGADPRVLRAMLANHQGIVVASLNGADIGAELPEHQTDGERFWRSVTISNAADELGTVAVEFSNRQLFEASASIRRQAVAIAILGMSLIAVVGLATGVLLTRKLDRVSVAARDLAAGNLDARTHIRGLSEIGQLGETFDSMASALKDSVEHYRSLVENAPISIHEIDVEGRLVSMNEAGRRMMDVADGVGTLFLELVDPEHHPAARGALGTAFGGQPGEFEFTRTVGGTTKAFQSGFYPIRDKSGRVVRIMGLAQDVTERRKAEKALEASESQLRQAQKMEAIGLLAGGVAHDFNNILTVINGYSELLLTIDDLPQRGRVEEISKAAQRATSLTQQLLAFSRRQLLEPRVMELNAVVAEARKMLSRVIGEDIELVTELDPALGNVKADPGQIHQVVVNLIVNARDAMPDGGKIRLSTKNVDVSEAMSNERDGLHPGTYVVLMTRDDGIGMTQDVASHIFEPFFTTKDESGGTGLGLSTVYGIVKQSGGYIDVSSEPGEGTTFEIFLPRVSDEVRATKPTATSPAEVGGTILVVEDDDSVRELTRNILVDHGYDVLEAVDGRSALRLLHARGDVIRLMITDLVMPNMGGPELVANATRRHRNLRILFTTGYAGGAPSIALGGEAHLLRKPFTSSALVNKVGEVLHGTSAHSLTEG